jgi:hypothetical protein
MFGLRVSDFGLGCAFIPGAKLKTRAQDFLCATSAFSAVRLNGPAIYRRAAENAEVAQRLFYLASKTEDQLSTVSPPHASPPVVQFDYSNPQTNHHKHARRSQDNGRQSKGGSLVVRCDSK